MIRSLVMVIHDSRLGRAESFPVPAEEGKVAFSPNQPGSYISGALESFRTTCTVQIIYASIFAMISYVK
jgi:hypothetical protein